MNNQIIAKNLKHLIETLDCYDYEFADSIGMNRTVLSYTLRGMKSITVTQVFKILKVYPTINLNWLIKGEGKMWETKPSSVTKPVTKAHTNRNPKPAKSAAKKCKA